MAFNFFNRGRLERSKALGDRLPPGQYATEKWPVLHYGSVPRVDLKTWDFKVWGEVDPGHAAVVQHRPLLGQVLARRRAVGHRPLALVQLASEEGQSHDHAPRAAAASWRARRARRDSLLGG